MLHAMNFMNFMNFEGAARRETPLPFHVTLVPLVPFDRALPPLMAPRKAARE